MSELEGSSDSGEQLPEISRETKFDLIDLVDQMKDDREHGSLNFYFDIREYLVRILHNVKHEDLLKLKLLEYPEIREYNQQLDKNDPYDLTLFLILVSYYSLKYVDYWLPKIESPSLRAIVKLCYSPEMTFNLGYRDPELDVLADIFNNSKYSARKNLHCYDCGTTARWVLYNCLAANRGRFYMTEEELQSFRSDYYNKWPDSFVSLYALAKTLETMNKPGIVLVGVRFGDGLFGHIFVIEKVFVSRDQSQRSIYRLYQSALNSYLLIDYLAKMRYMENESKGIDLREFLTDMTHLISPESWGETEEQLFAKWFAFWPQDEILDTTPIRFNHAFITY